MKALLVCLSAIILQAGSCGDDGGSANCPPCERQHVDSTATLEPKKYGKEMIDNYSRPETKYVGVQQMSMNVKDLQALVNMCMRDNRETINVYFASLTPPAAESYVRDNSMEPSLVPLATNQPIVLMGYNRDKVFNVRTMICPPPATCGMDADR
ncbi:hypothetical protein [Polluticoccus soli]|uniref:hypothetical protein n=1 Tax=Polluticoccus soli TaxID=3034150 RepID=UPI0023E10357|nr:hypothetical protein [Flavipsychrobacter sp. JY13-12]